MFCMHISKKITIQQWSNIYKTIVYSTQKFASTTVPLKKANSSDDDDLPVEMENPYKPMASRCTLCGVHVDYKNVQLLSQFVSSFTGLQYPKKSVPTLCHRKYDEVTKAIRMSQMAGLMPFHVKEPAFLDDENLSTI